MGVGLALLPPLQAEPQTEASTGWAGARCGMPWAEEVCRCRRGWPSWSAEAAAWPFWQGCSRRPASY